MSSMTLPLSDIVNVTVQVNPSAVQPPQFNQALIVGTSAALPSYGANSRCRLYQGGMSILQAMLSDGFVPTSPEYLAAQVYLSQTPAPYYLCIGRQDQSAIGSYAIAAAGTNYVVGDRVTVTQTGAANGVLQVMAVAAGTGAVTALQYVSQGTGYTVASGLPCAGGTGTGLTINITALGETALQAVQACRVALASWYLFTVLNTSDVDSIALSEWAQTAMPVAQCFFVTSAANCLTGASNSVFGILQAGNYNRFLGTYATTQSGAAPNNIYMAAALMGVAMGRNTGLSNSYFILPFKNVVSVVTEPVTPSQMSAINNQNGNVYANFANTYNSLMEGETGDGSYFDQTMGLDMLVADLQYDLTNVLYAYPAIPQNDQGQSVLLHGANTACAKSVDRGFLSEGIWQGQTILKLNAGTSIPGYLNQSPTYASLGAKPANRQAAPIYCAVILSEAVQSIIIAVYVQQ
jgi:hypothetical protein